jgi:hypothetical protein
MTSVESPSIPELQLKLIVHSAPRFKFLQTERMYNQGNEIYELPIRISKQERLTDFGAYRHACLAIERVRL